jgi:hypothetical protein
MPAIQAKQASSRRAPSRLSVVRSESLGASGWMLPLLVGGGSEPRGGPSHDPRHGRSGAASRVGPTRVAVIRCLNARIVEWTLTSNCVLAVWRRSG